MRALAAAVLCVWVAAADDLPRHGMIGLTVGPGLAVQRVTPGGAGAAVGIQAGDILQSVDGAAVASTGQFVRAVSRHLGGEADERKRVSQALFPVEHDRFSAELLTGP